MIETKQRMMDMLPFYYRESPEVNAIMQGNAKEIARKRQEARDLLDQFFVNTATWGLADWERVLDLPPMPHSTVEFRRQRILARLNGTAPATSKYLTDLVNVYVSNKDARIVEYNGEYRFEAEIPLDSPVNMTDIIEAMDEVKPAHLGFSLTGMIEGESIVFADSSYSFRVGYPITNTFHTDNMPGYGEFGGLFAEDNSYSFGVDYPITNLFHTDEMNGAGVDGAVATTFEEISYNVQYPICGVMQAGKE